MVTSQEIVERSFYISLLHQALIRGLTINPENYLVENEDGLWVPTRELNEQYLHDKEAIEAELTKKGSGFYYIFGVGNNQSRGQKDLPRITLDLTAWYPGEIGLEKETYELDEASGLYQVIDYDYEPKSSRIDVHLCANNQQEMRILHEIMYRALPSRGYIKPYLNDYEAWKNSKFSPSGNIYIEVGNFYDHDDLQQGFLEKVYTYEVRDGLINPEILNETVTPISDISVLIDSALTLHVPELPYEYNIYPNIDHINFVYSPHYKYKDHGPVGDFAVDEGSTIDTGAKYVNYVTSRVDDYIVPISVFQHGVDVTDECTFLFPSQGNIEMVYSEHTLIFSVKSIIHTTYIKTDIIIQKGNKQNSISFIANFVNVSYSELVDIRPSEIFDYLNISRGTILGKAVGSDSILADHVLNPPVHYDIEQEAPWPLSFGTVTVNEGKPEPIYDEWFDLSKATFGRQGVYMYINMGDELNSQLWASADSSGGSFVITSQMATDDTFTAFTKGIQANAYRSLPGLHNRMCKTTSAHESTFITNYNYSNVDHVDLKLQICTDNNSGLTNIRINGVILDDYIAAQYGADWKDTVNWVRQTITFYDYNNDTSYRTNDRTCYHCCYLELTNIPVEVITNMGTTNNELTGFSISSASNSAIFYNFKLVRK